MNFSSQLETYSQSFYAMQDTPLDQIIIESFTLDQHLPTEKRDQVEYLFVESGSGTLHINGISLPLGADMLLRAFPFHLYGLSAAEGGVVTLCRCRFPLSLLMYLDVQKRSVGQPDQILEQACPLVTLGERDARQMRAILEEMKEELQRQELYCYNFALAGLLRILALFDRASIEQMRHNQPLDRGDAWKALQLIHMYFNKDGFDAATVSARIGTEPVRLGYLLRKLTGKGFADNLHEVRVRNACAMMRFKELSISFIARYVGYTSPATFHRVFKELKGATPDQYRTGALGASERVRGDTAWTILVYLLEHYSENLGLSDVAEHLFISENTAAHILRANFSLSFSELLEQIRLAYACALLGAGRLPVCDIALSVGFNSLRTFNRCFYARLGTTPTRYRNRLRALAEAENP